MKDKIKVIRRLGGIFLALGMVCMVLLFLIPKTEEETNTQTQNLGNEQETQETQKTQETPETQKPSTKPQNMKIIYQLQGGYYISFFGEDGREEKREYYSKEAKNIKTCEFSYEIDEEKGLYQMTSSTQNEKGEVVSHVLYTCDSALRPLLSEHYRGDTLEATYEYLYENDVLVEHHKLDLDGTVVNTAYSDEAGHIIKNVGENRIYTAEYKNDNQVAVWCYKDEKMSDLVSWYTCSYDVNGNRTSYVLYDDKDAIKQEFTYTWKDGVCVAKNILKES